MTKVISISDEAYRFLKDIKKEEESFSKTIMKIASENKKPLAEFYGKWYGDKKELDKIETEIEKNRKNFKTREIKLK